MSNITVALISPVCRICDVQANLEHFEGWIQKAAQQGAEWVGFPEFALTGYGSDPALRRTAEPIPGPSVGNLEQMAQSNNLYLSMGLIEKAGPDIYNAQVLVGPKGYIGHYRKRHPTRGEIEILGISAGTETPLFDVAGIRFGMNICYDSRFSDSLEPLIDRGIEMFHNPHINLTTHGRNADEWERGKLVYYLKRVIRARCHMLMNNGAGTVRDTRGQTVSFPGGAIILDPLGQVVARTERTDNGEDMVVAALDTDLTRYIPRFEAKKEPLASISRVRKTFELQHPDPMHNL